MEVGVCNCKVILDLSSVRKYLEELVAQLDRSGDDKDRRVPKVLISRRVDRLKEELQQLSEFDFDERYFDNLTRILPDLASYCDCPENMKRLYTRERKIRIDGKERIVMGPPRSPRIFDSRLISETNDAVSIDRKRIDQHRWLFDVVTIKDSGLSAFKSCLSCIPPIGDHMEIVEETKHFSSRYVFRPYHLAVSLWLRDEAAITLPSDLKGFLEGAINYISSQEWRTSIVLSAIAVESVLADLYEEHYKTPAPDTPLGDLFEKVKKKIEIDQDISSAVDTTNRARIAAVHRSRLPVSEKDAIDALWGAVVATQRMGFAPTRDLQSRKPTA